MATNRFDIPHIDPNAFIKDGPGDINDALDATDAAMAGWGSGTSLPAADNAGRFFRLTTTGQLYLDTGSAWLPVASTSGKSVVATEQSRSSTSYGLLTTPDRVQSIILPTDGLIEIYYQALWKQSVDGAGRAALFIGSNQLKIGKNDSAPVTQAAGSFGVDLYRNLHTAPFGLIDQQAVGANASDVTTGQVIGSTPITDLVWTVELGGSLLLAGSPGGAYGSGHPSGTQNLVNIPFGGACTVFAAAGTYDISVQFKATSGSVTAKNRKLWVRAVGF